MRVPGLFVVWFWEREERYSAECPCLECSDTRWRLAQLVRRILEA